MSSLTAMALRFAARRALDGATFADDRVHDSSIAPVDHMIEGGDDAAFIVVSTEDEEAEITGRDITNGKRTVDLVIEVAIAHPVTGEVDADSDGTPETEIVIPAADAGLELSLTLIVRQAHRALFEGGGPWSAIFRKFAIGVKKSTNRRGVGNKDGARFAARQIILTIEPISEPPFGHEPAEGEPWGELLALIEADGELAGIAPLIRQSITGTPAIAEWDRGRTDQGLTHDAARRIGPANPILPNEPPATITDGTLVEDTDDEQ